MTAYYWVILILSAGAILAGLSNHLHRLGEVERKLNLALEKLGVDPLAAMLPSQAVKDLACDPARKIEAIRKYRRDTGANLKHALKAVEALRTGAGTKEGV